MLRTTTTRSLPRALSKTIVYRSNSITLNTARFTSLAFKTHNAVTSLPKAVAASQLRWSTSGYSVKAGAPQLDKIDKEAEKKLGKEKLEVDKENVTATSSTSVLFESAPQEASGPGAADGDVLGGLKSDLKTIKETFALNEVPRESFYLGLAGTLPYLATSLSTVFLSYNINHAPVTGSTFMFTPENAHQYLAYIEPIQIGYGAVILSFLGAIHWGLEYAGYGGHHSYRRFAIGVAAPAVAWPTMLMPIEYALISQFAGFTALYFADTRATVRGWAPPWYATYRFVLTFIVGASIVLSLIGRGEIAFKGGKLPSITEGMRSLREQDRLEMREKESVKEARAEQATPGMKKGKSGVGKKMEKENDEEEESDDEAQTTPDDSEDEGENDGDEKKEEEGDEDKNKDEGGDEEQQDEKKDNQKKKANDEGSKQDDKAEEKPKGKK